MKLALFVIVLAALLAWLFVLFKPAGEAPIPKRAEPASPVTPPQSPSVSGSAAATPAQGITTDASSAAQTFRLVLHHGKLSAGPALIQVHKGDEIVIEVASDTADELHLHGYDLRARLQPGETTTLRFNATRTGRFGYELHHGKDELGALEVYPR